MAEQTLADTKEEKSSESEWSTSSYNAASQHLFQAAEQDLDEFDVANYSILGIVKNTLQFPNVTCPQLILTFYPDSAHYNVYPQRLEVTYQYRTALMLSSDSDIDFTADENKEIRMRPRIKGTIRHFNFNAEGLLSRYDDNLQADDFKSLKHVFLMVQRVLSEPIVPVASMYAAPKLEQIWKRHADAAACPCEFSAALPAAWSVYQRVPASFQAKLIGQLRDNLKTQLLQGYIARQQRLNSVIQKYKPLHAWLWGDGHWNFDDILHPDFLTCFNHPNAEQGRKEFLQKFVKAEVEQRVFSFEFFKPLFCDQLVAELRNYEQTDGLPKDRPNSMNNYGVILNYMGLEPFITALFDRYLTRIAQWLFPSNVAKHELEMSDEDLDFTFHGTLDHHHCFMVQYEMNADVFLDMHIDDSEVTFNINLLDEFSGAELAVCGLAGEKQRRNHLLSYVHQKGRCLVHSGRQRHGARPITAGERQNLIAWCRSSWYRTIHPHGSGKCACCKYAQKEFNDPDQICLSKTHDADFAEWQQKFEQQAGGEVDYVLPEQNEGHNQADNPLL